MKAETPTGLAAHPSGGSLSESQLGFPQVFSPDSKPPSSASEQHRTAARPRGPSCDAPGPPTSCSSSSPRASSKAAGGKGKGKLAKVWLPSPKEATKKLPHQRRCTSRVGQTPSASCHSGTNVGWGWQRRAAGVGQPAAGSLARGPRGPPRSPAAPPHEGGPAPEWGVGTAPRSGPARGR